MAAVPDILFRFIQSGPYFKYMALCECLDNQDLVQKLLDVLLEGSDDDEDGVRAPACSCLCQLLAECRQWKFMRPLEETDSTSPILARLESDEVLNRILNLFLQPAPPSEPMSPLKAAVIPLALIFLRHLLLPTYRHDVYVQVPGLPGQRSEGEVIFGCVDSSRNLSCLLPCLATFKSLLLTPPPPPAPSTEISQLPAPLGPVRIHIIRFLCHLLYNSRGMDSIRIVRELYRLDLFIVIIDLFFAHKWNSLLHSSVEFLFRLVLRRSIRKFNLSDGDSTLVDDTLVHSGDLSASFSVIEEDSSTDQSFKSLPNSSAADETKQSTSFPNPFVGVIHQIVVRHRFLERLMTVWVENENGRSESGFRRAGYMGHLRTIANLLVSFLLPSTAGSVGVSPNEIKEDNDTEDGFDVDDDDDIEVLRDDDDDDGRLNNSPNKTSFRSVGDTEMPADGTARQCADRAAEVRLCVTRDLSASTWENWQEFVRGDLARVNQASFINYDNFPNSLSSSSTLSENEVNPAPSYVSPGSTLMSSVERSYNQYNTQNLAVSFPEVFGFSEDEFDESADRFDDEIEGALSDLAFSLAIQEDNDNSALFELSCNEVVIAPDGEEVGNESIGLPIVCVETQSTPPGHVNGSPKGVRSVTPMPQSKAETCAVAEVGGNADGVTAKSSSPPLSLSRLKEVFEEVRVETENAEISAAADAEEDFLGFLAPSSRRQTNGSVSPPPCTNSFVHEGDLSSSGTGPTLPFFSPTDLQPQLALAPGPTPSNGRPVISLGQVRRLSSSSSSPNDSPPSVENLSSPTFDHWSPVEPKLSSPISKISSPDLPDVESLVLPRLILDDSKIGVRTSSQLTSSFSSMFLRNEKHAVVGVAAAPLPRPIQPTVRSHRLARTPLLKPNGHVESAAAGEQLVNGSANPPATSSRRKRLVNASADWTNDDDAVSWSSNQIPTTSDSSILHRSTSEGEGLSSLIQVPNLAPLEADFNGDDSATEEQSFRNNRFRTHTTLNLRANTNEFEAA
uniref:Serine/threonine-protein phosphatase 6 regulatory subunit 2 n=1 Tax=Mesocestoides corti TaxID=53468 RepID=A0A5K3FP53_MESCO